jgi:glycerol-3-phosphate acyltransferase PlsY
MSPADWSGVLVYLSAFAGGYLLGSIPFGLLLAKAAGLGDLREIGSGNIGATNVLRAGGKGLAALTLFLDAAKGTAAVLIAARWGEGAGLVAALGAFLGHLFPVWLGFKGGKGVATYLGVLAGLYWPAAAVFAATWLLVALLTRYSSLAALAASGASVLALALMGEWRLAALFLLLAALLYMRHATNIGRLAKGEEARIGEAKR